MNSFSLRALYLNLIFLLICITVNAQISSNDADNKDTTAYSKYDTIYVFFPGKTASLKAICSKGGAATFSWSKFDMANKTFSSQLKTDINVDASSISGIGQGGYKVNITNNSGFNESFVAWILRDTLRVSLEKWKTDTINPFYSFCDYVDIRFKADSTFLTYYNPTNTNNKYSVSNLSFKYECRGVPSPAGGIPTKINYDPNKKTYYIRDNIPPYQNTRFYLKATDRFGLSLEDNVVYKSIIPKAYFEGEGDSIVNGKNSAPFKVTFINKSQNMDSCIWYFRDNDTLYSTKTPITHTFYQPKTYRVTLWVQLNKLCIDSTYKDYEIAKPQITCPNVFTPGGKNPYFKIDNISIRRFKITIFSRWGKKVYEKEGDNMLDWEGWDGSIGGSHASDGAYYYTLEVYTWDKSPDPKLINANGRYSGFFYLFRAN